MLLKLFLTTALLAICGDAFKILVVFPLPGKSHTILGDGLVRHLLNAGHEVTYIQGLNNKNPHENLTQVHAASNYKYFNEDTLNIKSIMNKEQDLGNYDFLQLMMVNLSRSTVQDDNVQKLFRDPTKNFDLVLAEWMFSDLYSTLAAIYGVPFIWFSTLEPHWQITRLIDEPMNPAYSSDILLPTSLPFSFTERVNQLWVQFKGVLRFRRFSEMERQVYENDVVPIIKSRGRVVPTYDELVANTSLVLGNSHVSLGLAPRLPQSYKPIGGYHIDSKPSPLPADLQKMLDTAEHGVIYFSMGSNLKSKDIPQNLKTGFLKVFKELKQTVLWKFEEILPNLPNNVHIVTWAPQQSILAHPNCILFITHGGLLSTTEAVHYGKPTIGIPVFGDQFANVQRAVEKGFGRKVELSYTMDADLKVEINTILGDPTYAQKAKKWSFIYHDRPNTPGQELVHWTEHVIKTGGAAHLRSPALLLPWYQKMYLDLLALVILAIVVVFILLVNILKSFTKTPKSNKKKNN